MRPRKPHLPLLRRLAPVLLCAAGLGGALAPAASAAVYGVQGIPAGGNVTPAETARALDAAARSGAELVRVPADWSALEPRMQGQRDPAAVAQLDAIVDGVARRKMRTLLVIGRTPCWASSAPDKGSCSARDANRDAVVRFRPADVSSVVPIATFLAGRYADRLGAFQIWNEPDQVNEKYWAGPDKVRNYVAMVRALYGPLKQAAPKVPVLAGSFVGTDGRWLNALYKAGMKGFYDGLAVQFYNATLFGLRSTRGVQRAYGDFKPLWLTEFGYTSCYRRGGPSVQIDQRCVSRTTAARATADVLATVRTRPWIAATVQYALFDDPFGGYTFGLFDARGRAKPTYGAVRNVLSGRTRRARRPTVRLRASRGRVTASGSATITDILTVRVRQRGVLRFRARLLADRHGRWRLALPPVLGTRGLSVEVSAGWTGQASGRI